MNYIKMLVLIVKMAVHEVQNRLNSTGLDCAALKDVTLLLHIGHWLMRSLMSTCHPVVLSEPRLRISSEPFWLLVSVNQCKRN